MQQFTALNETLYLTLASIFFVAEFYHKSLHIFPQGKVLRNYFLSQKTDLEDTHFV